MTHDENERTPRTDAGTAAEAAPETACHEEAWRLLPWYVNGTLDGSELAAVESHVAACGICRQEIKTWSGFAELLQEEGELAPSAAEGFTRLERSLSHEVAREAPARPSRPERPHGPAGRFRRTLGSVRRAPAGVRWALAAQLAAIVVLAVSLTAVLAGRPGAGLGPGAGAAQGTEQPAPFRTLTDAAERAPSASSTEAPRLRVVFKESTREREIRGALISIGGRIVDGPSPTGVYTIRLVGSEEASGRAAAETLRSMPQVLFAEAVQTP